MFHRSLPSGRAWPTRRVLADLRVGDAVEVADLDRPDRPRRGVVIALLKTLNRAVIRVDHPPLILDVEPRHVRMIA